MDWAEETESKLRGRKLRDLTIEEIDDDHELWLRKHARQFHDGVEFHLIFLLGRIEKLREEVRKSAEEDSGRRLGEPDKDIRLGV